MCEAYNAVIIDNSAVNATNILIYSWLTYVIFYFQHFDTRQIMWHSLLVVECRNVHKSGKKLTEFSLFYWQKIQDFSGNPELTRLSPETHTCDHFLCRAEKHN